MSEHTIEPGDVIRFNPGTEYDGRVLVVDRVHGEQIMAGAILKWFAIADVTLIAKGLRNLPKPEPERTYPRCIANAGNVSVIALKKDGNMFNIESNGKHCCSVFGFHDAWEIAKHIDASTRKETA